MASSALITHFACFAWAVLPLELPAVDQVDKIELNHVYDNCGRATFHQLVFLDWTPTSNAYRVRAWRLYKYDSQRRFFDHRAGRWVCQWLDGEQSRRVTAPVFEESHTQYDVELHDRDYLSKEFRRGLMFQR